MGPRWLISILSNPITHWQLRRAQDLSPFTKRIGSRCLSADEDRGTAFEFDGLGSTLKCSTAQKHATDLSMVFKL